MKCLDLFCGAGGAALGLTPHFDVVVGVDINKAHARRYPGEFVCADATAPPFDLRDFDFVWASPPCQAWVFGFGRPPAKTAHLLFRTRELLRRSGRPCVIENVPTSPVRPDMVITAPMVGLPRMLRRRHFELIGFAPPMFQRIEYPKGRVDEGTLISCTRSGTVSCRHVRRRRFLRGLPHPGYFTKRERWEAMGLDRTGADYDCWTNACIGEAVPPAYADAVVQHWKGETQA